MSPFPPLMPPSMPPVPRTPPVTVASSSADGLAVHLTFDGKAADFGPVALVAGSAMPAYDRTGTVAQVDQTLSLRPGSLLDPSLHVIAADIDTEAASAGIGIDAVSARGEASIGSADFVLTDNPLLPRGILSLLGLSVSASHIDASATYSHVYGADSSFVSSSASFGSLRLGGALIGKELTFSGDAAPNTVLFSSPTVIVTLDRQTVADLISGGLNKTSSPAGITTQAIDVSLHNAALFGGSVSGDIIIGQAFAGAGGVPAAADFRQLSSIPA